MTTTAPVNADVPIVFADTETDSLNPRTRQPWDIALIRREPSGRETEYQFFVELDLSISDPFALAIGKFDQRHPLGKWRARGGGFHRPEPTPAPSSKRHDMFGAPAVGRYLTRAYAAEHIARITHGAHIVGAIPSFDTITMEPLLWEAGLAPTWHHHIIDVEALAVGYIKGRIAAGGPRIPATHPDATLAPPWKSDFLHALLDLEPIAEEDRHTALGDARWARAFYDKIMGTSAREPDLDARTDPGMAALDALGPDTGARA